MRRLTENGNSEARQAANRWKLRRAQDKLDRARSQAIQLIATASTTATATHLNACARAIDQSVTDACIMLECAKEEPAGD